MSARRACSRRKVYAIIEIHSGESVKLDATDEGGVDGRDPAIFDTEEAAQVYAMKRFGPDAGKEYVIVDAEEIQ